MRATAYLTWNLEPGLCLAPEISQTSSISPPSSRCRVNLRADRHRRVRSRLSRHVKGRRNNPLRLRLIWRIRTKTPGSTAYRPPLQERSLKSLSTRAAMGTAMKDPVEKSEKDPVQIVKQLLRTVVRMFYETEHIVIMDALCYHGALPVADMTIILDAGKNSKHVSKVAGKLREAGLCSS